ncbi:hypothetical protein A1Q2_04267 [Trichosporon asahii var. asahii CBS 8904]|uniref:F-box domain-containing protein n=1 Tax=Trichosporon asahii var. asahii (strain CBS 8904) TaxID=1220162 RepID=K1VBM2_TRIAC|nr:hypothetical protein A1Q2_04267 [Trichosporon asahii var. asahii CBS 8904]
MLQLPVELRLIILRLLPREDMFTLLTVSKELKALVHPLFYEHMLFTKAGFAFPHAPNPFPLLDVPNLQVLNPVPDEERESIVNGIHTITIVPHFFASCAGWQNLQKRILPPNAEVLKVELAFPSPDGIACGHRPVRCGHCGRCQMNDDDHDADGAHPFPECGFIDALHSITPNKVVIKNYPALLNGRSSTCLPKLADAASEFVVVLEPHALPNSETVGGYYFADACPDGDDHMGAMALMDMIPSNATEVTLVFMTPKPGTEWAPGCKHYEYDWYARGCVTPCPCGGGCCDRDVLHSDDDVEEEQQSCWQSEFWRDLASGVAKSKARINIVNYSAIIPDGVNRFEALETLKRGGKRLTARKTFLNELRDAHETKEAYDARLPNVHLMSMENWIRSGAWEDVFERKEISLWLDRVEKLKTKAKWKAIAKKPKTKTAKQKVKSAKASTTKDGTQSAEAASADTAKQATFSEPADRSVPMEIDATSSSGL